MPELNIVDDRIVTVFVVDKRLNKIIKSPPRITFLKRWPTRASKSKQIMNWKDFKMWEILLPTSEDRIVLTRPDLQIEDNIIRVEYQGQGRTKVSVFEVPNFVSR